MRDGRGRTRTSVRLAPLASAAFLLACERPAGVDEAPAQGSLEIAETAPAVAISVSAPVEPAKAPTRCAPEPPLVLGNRVSSAVSELVFGTADPWGSASIGTPTRGSLVAGVELTPGDGIELAGDYHWGTASVVRSIERAVREVRRCHPGAPDLYVGDISREEGGWLRPHRSHQAGLDADIGFYYVGPASWYERATAKNLDVVRTWALFRALVDGGNVETIFVDRSIQELLKAHLAKAAPADRPPEGFFEKSRLSPAIVRHTWGHATHFHVRFRDPDAVERGLALVDPMEKGPNRVVRVRPRGPAKGSPKKR